MLLESQMVGRRLKRVLSISQCLSTLSSFLSSRFAHPVNALVIVFFVLACWSASIGMPLFYALRADPSSATAVGIHTIGARHLTLLDLLRSADGFDSVSQVPHAALCQREEQSFIWLQPIANSRHHHLCSTNHQDGIRMDHAQ